MKPALVISIILNGNVPSVGRATFIPYLPVETKGLAAALQPYHTHTETGISFWDTFDVLPMEQGVLFYYLTLHRRSRGTQRGPGMNYAGKNDILLKIQEGGSWLGSRRTAIIFPPLPRAFAYFRPCMPVKLGITPKGWILQQVSLKNSRLHWLVLYWKCFIYQKSSLLSFSPWNRRPLKTSDIIMMIVSYWEILLNGIRIMVVICFGLVFS